MQEIDLRTAIQTNVLKLGTAEFEAFDDRIIIVQDEFSSGYECVACRAKDIRMIDVLHQASVVPCEDCGATGRVTSVVKAATRECLTCSGKGWHPCAECNGTGTADGGIAHSQNSENQPTTGTIVSIGDRVTRLSRGQGVLYMSYTGAGYKLTAQDIHGNDVELWIVIMHEHEVLSKLKGHLELRRVKRKAALSTAM